MSAPPAARASRWAWLRELPAALAATLRRETLPPPPAGDGPARPSAWGWLLAPERLPAAPAASSEGPGPLRWLLASERLPELPPEPARPSALGWLVASERLPHPDELSSPAPPRELGLLRWLLSSERLDERDPDPSSRGARP